MANEELKNFIVIASKMRLDYIRIASELMDHHYTLLIADDEFTFGEMILDPRCSAAFLDDNFCDNPLLLFRKFAPHTRTKLIFCLRGSYLEKSNQTALKAGAFLVLHNPISPTQYLIRTKQVAGLIKQGTSHEKKSRTNGITNISALYQHQLINLKNKALPPPGIFTEDSAGWTESANRWSNLFGSFLEVEDKNLNNVEHHTHRTLSTLSTLAQNSSISLHTFRPFSPLDSKNSKVRKLSCSRTRSGYGPSESIEFYPELKWLLETEKMIIIPNTMAVSEYRKLHFRTGEKGIICIPIRNKKGELSGALRITFPTALDATMKSFAKDLEAFSKKLTDCFSRIDFFSRIYNQDPNFYETQLRAEQSLKFD